MARNLDLTALRAFVAVVDSGSFTRAGQRLGRFGRGEGAAGFGHLPDSHAGSFLLCCGIEDRLAGGVKAVPCCILQMTHVEIVAFCIANRITRIGRTDRFRRPHSATGAVLRRTLLRLYNSTYPKGQVFAAVQRIFTARSLGRDLAINLLVRV